MMIDRHIDSISNVINKTPEEIRKSVICLDITNVDDYMSQFNKEWTIKDFPNIRFPWEYLWAEYKFNYCGIECKKNIKNVGIFGGHDNHLNIMGLAVFIEKDNGNISLWGGLNLYLINNEWEFQTFSKFPHLDEDTVSQALFECVSTLFLAISFCHCKNISLISDPVPIKLNKSRIKKGKLPFFRFNKIVIDPMKEILKREGQAEQTGLKRALHICRGHFATYTAEAPLFGKVTGTVWKPMHLRGEQRLPDQGAPITL